MRLDDGPCHPGPRGMRYVGITIAALIAVACGPTTPGTTASTTFVAGEMPVVGRSVCAGSAPLALRRVDSVAADTLERLQGTYENALGFMAVIHDGAKPIVVVEVQSLSIWRAQLARDHIAVAPSCVDTRLLAAVHAALRLIPLGDSTITAGYDALDDAISVRGVGKDQLLAALDEVWPDSNGAAEAAIAAGTLRIGPQPLNNIVR